MPRNLTAIALTLGAILVLAGCTGEIRAKDNPTEWEKQVQSHRPSR